MFKHNPNLVKKIEKPIIENYGDKLILANHSLKQLNIISDNRFEGKLSCVLNFLNNCLTTIGKRNFQYKLLNPITNQEILNRSYDITEHTIKNNYCDKIRQYLNNIKDFEKIKRKFIMNKITPKDIYNLYNNLLSLKDLNKFLSKDNKINKYFKNFIDCDINIACDKMIKFLDKFFDINKCKNLDDLNPDKLNNILLDNILFIKKSNYEDLDNKFKNCVDSREQLEAIKTYFCDTIKSFEKSSKTNDFIKIHETPKLDPQLMGTKRRVNLLKNELQKKIKENKNSIISINYLSKFNNKEEIFNLNLENLEYKTHGSNQSNLIITSNQISKISTSIQSCKEEFITCILDIYNKIIIEFLKLDEFEREKSYLDNIIKFISESDILQCNSYIAKKYNLCKPQIINNDKSFVSFKKIRHCLIEHINTNELYVSNDLELGKDINGILLYGTNAVGKTSFIKAIGISIIMAQAGLYVPCEEYCYNPYNYLFTRILGNDNLFKGLSTFAVEMSELRTILTQANNNSLILGDELCSGTESSSATSIFSAGLEYLHSINTSFIFATHFHEVANYPEIKNLNKLKFYHMAVEYDIERQKLIYNRKIKEGIGETMYGLEVCKSLDLPSSFLNKAHEYRIKYYGDKNLLSNKGSHFNREKIKGKCEICNLLDGTEVHHLQYQKNAKNNIIGNEFNKNHKANLINICNECHKKIHDSNIEYKKVKTTIGYELKEI